jgi:hypothetical protein
MIIDLLCSVVLGLLFGSQFVHYLEHVTKGTRFSYARLAIIIVMMFAVILLSANIDGGWNKNLFTEIIPFIVPILTAIVYVSIYRRVKMH